jgi:hypothetical protein
MARSSLEAPLKSGWMPALLALLLLCCLGGCGSSASSNDVTPVSSGGSSSQAAATPTPAASPSPTASATPSPTATPTPSPAASPSPSPPQLRAVRAFSEGAFSGTFRPLIGRLVDLNGDGVPDLVAVNDAISGTSQNNISVSLAKGDGTYLAPRQFAAGTGLVGLAVGDFNKDGRPDVATIGSGFHGFNLLLGNGDGSFQAPIQVNASTSLVAITAADADGDGNIDVVAADNTSGNSNILFYKGAGNANFDSTQVMIPTAVAGVRGEKPAAATPANLTPTVPSGSGFPPVSSGIRFTASQIDLVATATPGIFSIVVGGKNQAKVGFIPQTAADTFDDVIQSSVVTSYSSIEVGDFNHDNLADLAVMTSSTTAPFGPVVNTYNDVRTTFATALTPPVPMATPTPTPVPAQVINLPIPNDLVGGVNHPLPQALASGDVDGRNGVDLVAADFNLQQLYVILNNGSATPYPTTPTPLAWGVGPGVSYIGIGDVNADQKADMVTLNVTDNTASVALGNGDGTVQTALQTTYAPSGNVGPPTAGPTTLVDVNGDGKLDLITGQGNGANLFLGNGDGSFATAATALVNAADLGGATVVVADFNGDQRPDVAVGMATSKNVRVYLNNGTATPFTGGAGVSTPVNGVAGLTGVSQLAAADFGNGHVDLVVSDGSNLAVLLGDGSGNFPAALALGGGSSVAIADMNGDGKPDIVSVDNNGLIKVFLDNGSGTGFTASATLATGVLSGLNAVAVGDFTGDGRNDVVTASAVSANNQLILVAGIGDGTLAASLQVLPLATVFGTSPTNTEKLNANALVPADLNGDGTLDLVVSTQFKVGVLLNGGSGLLAGILGYDTNFRPGVAAVGDVNGDGHLDVVVSNTGGGPTPGTFVISSILQQ